MTAGGRTLADFNRSGMVIHAQDVNELRTGIISGDGGATSFAGATAHGSVIKAQDFTFLANGIQSLWNAPNPTLGPLPAWSSGVTPGGPSLSTTKTPIYQSDLMDLRQWLNLYEIAHGRAQTNWTYGAGSFVVVNQVYDVRGLVTSASVPHLVTSQAVAGQYNAGDYNATNPATTFTYDSLKRPLTTVEPDGISAATSRIGVSCLLLRRRAVFVLRAGRPEPRMVTRQCDNSARRDHGLAPSRQSPPYACWPRSSFPAPDPRRARRRRPSRPWAPRRRPPSMESPVRRPSF